MDRSELRVALLTSQMEKKRMNFFRRFVVFILHLEKLVCVSVSVPAPHPPNIAFLQSLLPLVSQLLAPWVELIFYPNERVSIN